MSNHTTTENIDPANLIPTPWAELPQWMKEVKIEAAKEGREVTFPDDAPPELLKAAAENNEWAAEQRVKRDQRLKMK